MPGSKLSCAGPMTILNTIVAEVLDQFYDKLSCASDFNAALSELIKQTISENKNIIFNGNGYSDEWPIEAEKRGLLNLKSTPDAVPVYLKPKNIDVLSKHGVYSKVELESRVEIFFDEYVKIVNIEALTMIDMAKKDILPAVMTYVKELSETAVAAQTIGADLTVEKELVGKLSTLAAATYKALGELEEAVVKAGDISDTEELARYYHDVILVKMGELRAPADQMESLCGEKYWPYPTYEHLLFYVK
jgi:glutamine synthetase